MISEYVSSPEVFQESLKMGMSVLWFTWHDGCMCWNEMKRNENWVNLSHQYLLSIFHVLGTMLGSREATKKYEKKSVFWKSLLINKIVLSWHSFYLLEPPRSSPLFFLPQYQRLLTALYVTLHYD